MRLACLLPFAILPLLAAPAWAQPGLAPPGQLPARPMQAPTYLQQPQLQQPQLETRTLNYGWHVFAADALSWTMLSAASNGQSEGIATLGAAGIFLGGPIVHLAHGNSRGAGYSLLARTALPLGSAALVLAACDDSDAVEDDWACVTSAVAATMLGYGAALAIDWFYLAEKTDVVSAATGWASLRPSLNIAPTGAQAGLAFSF